MLRRIGYTYLIILAVALLASCSQTDATDGPQGGDGGASRGEYTLSLYLESGDAQSALGSRATPANGSYDPGQGAENYLDIDGLDFCVALYSADDAHILTVDNSAVTITPLPFLGDRFSSKRYFMQFDISADVANYINQTGTIKVVMLANWRGSYPELAAGKLGALYGVSSPVDYSAAASVPGFDISSTQKIPMFGVSYCSQLDVRPNLVEFLGTIHLLRALAKVEVFDSEDSSAPITGVTLTRRMTAAMPLPEGVTHQDHYVTGSYLTDYTGKPSIPWSAGAKETSEPLFIRADTGNHYVVYIPEFPNASRMTDSDRARLRVDYKDCEPYFIDFKYYQDCALGKKDTYFDILRNNWYQFEVTKIVDRIKVEVQVFPYVQVELEPEFGVDTGRNLVAVRNENGQVIYWYDPETGDFYGTDKTTLIPNPNISSNPVNGWTLMRDENNQFVCYYDATNNRYYGWDRKTRIANPFDHVDAETSWLIVQNPACTRIYYYYDRSSSHWYLPDKKTRVERPFQNMSEIS